MIRFSDFPSLAKHLSIFRHDYLDFFDIYFFLKCIRMFRRTTFVFLVQSRNEGDGPLGGWNGLPDEYIYIGIQHAGSHSLEQTIQIFSLTNIFVSYTPLSLGARCELASTITTFYVRPHFTLLSTYLILFPLQAPTTSVSRTKTYHQYPHTQMLFRFILGWWNSKSVALFIVLRNQLFSI